MLHRNDATIATLLCAKSCAFSPSPWEKEKGLGDEGAFISVIRI
jgi:hypothetical protein